MISLARSEASPPVKLPEICAVPPNEVKVWSWGWICGADCTMPSSTIATCLWNCCCAERVPLRAARAGEVHGHGPPLPRQELGLGRADRLPGEPRLPEVVPRRGLPAGLVRQHDAHVALVVERVVVGMLVSAPTLALSHASTAAFASAGVAGGAVVVVVAPGAVVGAVVEVVAALACAASDARPAAITGRNRSSAVWPTRRSALARSFTPGRSTTMSVPWREISGSATPRPSTRVRMMSTATSSEPPTCTCRPARGRPTRHPAGRGRAPACCPTPTSPRRSRRRGRA